MARTIDERIVKLSVENGGFEGALAKSKASLGSFFSGLSKLGSSDPMSKISTGAQNASKALQSVGVNTEQIGQRFNALSTIATGALLTIGSKAVQTGAQLVKSMTIDPVKSGFDQYQQKMSAVGVVSANTGESMGKINQVLDDMNDYAMKTKYSFGDMTTNLGYFTAAGVKLDTAKDSIKGISNLAATVGSSSSQASMAMYQLSQAMSSGTVKLQDWNSVQNANMGGQKFQKSLEDTAKAMGKGRDMSVSFRDSLHDGWITTEVLTKTLEGFANDKSMLRIATQSHTLGEAMENVAAAAETGWAKMFESLIGGYDESTKVWTGLANFGSNVVGILPGYFQKVGKAMRQAGSDGVTPMDSIVKSVQSIGTSLGTILKGPINFLQAAFKTLGNAGLSFFTDKLPAAFKIVASILSVLAKAMGPINSMFSIMGNVANAAFSILGKALSSVGKGFSNLGKLITDTFSSIGKKLQPVVDFIKKSFQDLGTNTHKSIRSSVDRISKAWSGLTKLFGPPFSAARSLIGRELDAIVLSFTSKVGKLQSPIDDLKEAWGNIIQVFKNVGTAGVNLLKSLIPHDTGLYKFLTKLSEGSTDFLNSINPQKQSWVKDFSSKILDWSKSLETTSGKLTGYVDKLKDWVKHNEIARESIKQLKKAFDGIKDFFTIPTVSANSKGGGGIDDLSGKVQKSASPMAGALDLITGKFAELNYVLKDPAIKAAAITFGVMIMVLGSVSKIGKALTAGTNAIKAFQKSTTTLMGAVKAVPQSISGMFTSIGTAFTTLAKSIGTVGLILAWSFAVKQLSDSLSVLASIPTGEITKGMVAIVAFIAALSIGMKVMSMSMKSLNPKQLIGLAGSLIAMASAIAIMSIAMGALQGLNLLTLIVDLAVFTAAMVILTKTLSKATIDPKAGVALIGMAVGLLAMAAAVALISQIPMGSMITSVALLAGVMLALGIAGKGLSMGSAATMLAMAVAIGVMAVSLALLSMIPLANLGAALLILTGALLVFIGGAALLGLIAPLIAAAAVPMMLLGAAVLILGAGLALAGIGIAIFAATFVLAVTALIAGLFILIAGLVKLAPLIIQNTGTFALMALAMIPLVLVVGLLAVGMVLLGAGVAILGLGMLLAAAGIILFSVGLLGLGIAAPIAAAGIVAFVTIISTLSSTIGGFVDIAFQIALGLGAIGLGAVVAGVGALVAAVGILALGLALAAAGLLALAFAASFRAAVLTMLDVMSVIPGVGGKFKEAASSIRDSGMSDEASKQGKATTDAMNQAKTGAGQAGQGIGSSAKGGLSGGLAGISGIGKKGGSDANSGLSSLMGSMGSTGKGLGTSGKGGLTDGLSSMLGAGKKGGSDANSGLGSMKGIMGTTGQGLGTSAKGGLTSGSAGTRDLGANLGSSFGDGISSMVGSVVAKASSLASSAVSTIKSFLRIGSPSKVMTQFGKWTGEGLSIGMTNSLPMVTSKAELLARRTVEAMSGIADAANEALADNLDFAPTVTPVLNGKNLNYNSNIGLGLGGQISSAQRINAQTQVQPINAAVPQSTIATNNSLDAVLATLNKIADQGNQPVTAIMSTAQASSALTRYSVSQDRTQSMFKG